MSAGLDGFGVMYESATPYDGAALCLKAGPRSKVANKKQVGPSGAEGSFKKWCRLAALKHCRFFSVETGRGNILVARRRLPLANPTRAPGCHHCGGFCRHRCRRHYRRRDRHHHRRFLAPPSRPPRRCRRRPPSPYSRRFPRARPRGLRRQKLLKCLMCPWLTS